MTDEMLNSVLLGVSIGGVYVLAAYLSFRFALGRSHKIFFVVALGGVGARLFVATALISLVLALTAVNQPAFFGGFFAVFVVGLVLEIVFLHRGQLAAAQKAAEISDTDGKPA